MDRALRFSQPSGQIALHIAAFLSRPLDHLTPARRAALFSDVAGHDLTALSQSAFAPGAMQRYARQVTGVDRIDIPQGTLGQLRTESLVQTALRLALGADAALMPVRRKLLAAICRDQIRGAMLKQDRAAIAQLIGADLVEFASREAAVFHPALSAYAAQAGTVLRADDTVSFEDHPARAFADTCLAAALTQISPLAAQIYTVRFAPAASAPVTMTPEDAGDVLKLAEAEGAA